MFHETDNFSNGVREILRVIRGRWKLGVTRPDSLGVVRDLAVRRSPFGFRTGRALLKQSGLGL
jgi:hypothetical protein